MKLASSEPKSEVTSIKQFWKLQAEAQSKDLQIIKKHIRASVGEEIDSGHSDQAECDSLKMQPNQDLRASQESDKSDILSKILPAISLAETLSPWVLTSPYLQVLGYDKISIKLERSSQNGTHRKIKEVSFVKPHEIIQSLNHSISVPQVQPEKPKQVGQKTKGTPVVIQEQKKPKSTVNQPEAFVKEQPVSQQDRTKQKEEDYISVVSSKSLKKRGGRKNKQAQSRSKKRNTSVSKQLSNLHGTQKRSLVKQSMANYQQSQSVRSVISSVGLKPTLQEQNDNEQVVFPKRLRQETQQKDLAQSGTVNFGAKPSEVGVAIGRARRNPKQPAKYAVDQYLARRKTRQNIDQIKVPPPPRIYNHDQVYENQSNQFLNDSIQPNDKSESTKQTDKISAYVAISPLEKSLNRVQQQFDRVKQPLEQKILPAQSSANYNSKIGPTKNKNDPNCKNDVSGKYESALNDRKDDTSPSKTRLLATNVKVMPNGTVKRPRGRPFGWRKPRQMQIESSKKNQQQANQPQKNSMTGLKTDLTAPSKLIEKDQGNSSYLDARLVQEKLKKPEAQIFEQSATPVVKQPQNYDSDKDFYEEEMHQSMTEKQSKASSRSKTKREREKHTHTHSSKSKNGKQHQKEKHRRQANLKKSKDQSISKKNINILQEINKSVTYPSYQYQQTYQQMIARKAKQAAQKKKEKDSFDESEGNSQDEQIGASQEKILHDLMKNNN